MKVGFIGLGLMGGSMASNLQKAGFAVAVHDLRPKAAEPHLAAGAVWKNTPREVAEASDVVCTSLPGPPEVDAVALGADGLIHGLCRGSAWFDLSTNSPTAIRRLHATFAERGVSVCDAPVSGGPTGARTRKLAIWVGGDRDVYERHKTLLDAIGDEPYYVGPIGAGAVAKLVHNCATFTVRTALAEVFCLGVKAGVEPGLLWKAVRQGSTGRRRTFDRLLDAFLPAKFDPPSFALRLAHKDMTLATGLGRELGVPMRVADLVHAEMTEAMNRGWGERDSSSPMLLEEERSGVQIAVKPDELQALIAEREGR